MIGEALLLSHFFAHPMWCEVKNTDFYSLRMELLAIVVLTVVVDLIAITRYLRTLD
ncbi:MAG: hypothetical protein ACI965_000767 [Paraglaciecola sp.]|jgi:hypothetical protein